VIRHSEHLVGFTDHEVEIIALVARYHRKSAPRPKHPEYFALGKPDREEVRALAAEEGSDVVVISARIEEELTELGDDEARAFLADMGLSEPGLDRLVEVGYHTLGLLTFLTAGEKEVRAWTVRRGARAPEAAGVIHSDFQHGFIRAEVIAWEKLVEAGSIAAARSRGWLRTEGKDYVVEDGDVMHFLFNV